MAASVRSWSAGRRGKLSPAAFCVPRAVHLPLSVNLGCFFSFAVFRAPCITFSPFVSSFLCLFCLCCSLSASRRTLMPLRTTMNFQYRYGTSTTEAFKRLMGDGGFTRFYRGLGPALIQAPLSRFGDTAANAGALALFSSLDATRGLPVAVQTVGASVTAALFRIFLVPVDTLKTMMQVEGKDGAAKLMAKVRKSGPTALFHGALATSAATFVGHYPWFAVYNTLQEWIPKRQDTMGKLARNAGIGFCATLCSDTISNSVRVIKTYRQTATETISYAQCIKDVIAKDGISGLMFRGLKTRIVANGLQGIIFSVAWKVFEEQFNKRADAKQAEAEKSKST